MTDTDAAELLEEARGLLERVSVEGLLVQGERAYLLSTASRLSGMAAQLRGDTRVSAPAPRREAEDVPKAPRRLYTRKEAAQLVGVHANTLLNWETRGLVQARRDARGWRVYGREELARAMALAAHLPLAEAEQHGRAARG